jgi:hypothetical protein
MDYTGRRSNRFIEETQIRTQRRKVFGGGRIFVNHKPVKANRLSLEEGEKEGKRKRRGEKGKTDKVIPSLSPFLPLFPFFFFYTRRATSWRVKPAWVPWVAAADPHYAARRAPDRPVLPHRFDEIDTARRLKTAMPPEYWAEGPAIDRHQPDQQPARQPDDQVPETPQKPQDAAFAGL